MGQQRKDWCSRVVQEADRAARLAFRRRTAGAARSGSARRPGRARSPVRHLTDDRDQSSQSAGFQDVAAPARTAAVMASASSMSVTTITDVPGGMTDLTDPSSPSKSWTRRSSRTTSGRTRNKCHGGLDRAHRADRLIRIAEDA